MATRHLTVFLSYEREASAELAHALYTAMAPPSNLLGLDARIDTRDIIAPELWDEKIEALIDESDAFVLLLGPQTVAPDCYCRLEWRHALKRNKKIVVVRLNGLRDPHVPKELRRLQHLTFAQAGPTYPAASIIEFLQALQMALLSDAEWVAEHNRLAGLAREWRRQPPKDQPFYTLNLSQVEKAVAWLGKWTPRQPEPTHLHHKFIEASAKTATWRARQRWIEYGVFGGLVLLAAWLYFKSVVIEKENDAVNQLVGESTQTIDANATPPLPTPNPGASAPGPSASTDVVRALIQQFAGPERRKASDRLAAIYGDLGTTPAVRDEIVPGLVAALQPKSAISSYRVNLYVLVTLARMPGWRHEDTERSEVEKAARMYADDATYRSWTIRALGKAEPPIAVP